MRKYSVAVLCVAFLFLSVSAQKNAKLKRAPIDTTKFVLVEGGIFMMGTDKPVEKHEGPPHQVTVNSFYLAKTETTFNDFDNFTGSTKRDSVPSGSWGRGKNPVFMVSWLDAVNYCNWLSEKEKLSKYYMVKGDEVRRIDTAKGYRLPTEAEWEFAARGGIKNKEVTYYSGSNQLPDVAWYVDNSEARAHVVGGKKSNELGLFDMSGNVWEWVWDVYDGNYYNTSPADNPCGPEAGAYRVMRGGAWYNYSNYSTIYTRQYNYPGFRQNSVGFRIARTY